MPRLRHPVLAAAVAAVATLTGVAAVAAPSADRGRKAERVDTITIGWRDAAVAPANRSSKTWAPLPLLAPRCQAIVPNPCKLALPARGLAAVTLSGTFQGGPVEIRLTRSYAGEPEAEDVFHPGVVTFAAGKTRDSFAYTFVHPNPGSMKCDGPMLQWRSPTGKNVSFVGGTVVAHYEFHDPHPTAKCL